MAYITVIASDGRTFRRELEGDLLKIGRSSKNDLNLSFDLSLSRFHAEIRKNDTGFYLSDVGSRNGTSLNGKPVLEPMEMKIGDRINLGETTILFGVEEEPRVAIEEDAHLLKADSSTVTIPLEDIISSGPPLTAKATVTPERALSPDNRALQVVMQAGMELINDRPLDAVLELIMDLVFQALPAERGFLMLLEGADKHLVSKVVRDNKKNHGGKISLSRTIARIVIENRQAVLTSDAQEDERFKMKESVVLQGIHSALCVPLWNNKAVIGLIYADTVSAAAFKPEDLKLLTLLGNIAAVKIENARLFEETLAKQRMEKEMQQATEIQKKLLPVKVPIFEGYALSGFNDPCREVGGDYFDYIERGPDKLGFTVADVSGKGMGAALLMATVRASFRAHMEGSSSIRSLISSLNESILQSANSNNFVSFFYGEIQKTTGSLQYVNAGHNPPLLVRAAGGVEELPAGGLILGVVPAAKHEVRTVTMEPGDLLVAFSDGVTETQNEKGEEFGEDRLSGLVQQERAKEPAELELLVRDGLKAFAGTAPQYDDVTLVIVKREA